MNAYVSELKRLKLAKILDFLEVVTECKLKSGSVVFSQIDRISDDDGYFNEVIASIIFTDLNCLSAVLSNKSKHIRRPLMINGRVKGHLIPSFQVANVYRIRITRV